MEVYQVMLLVILVARGHQALMYLLGETVIGHYYCSFLLLHAALPISLCLFLITGPTLTLLIELQSQVAVKKRLTYHRLLSLPLLKGGNTKNRLA